MNMESRPVEVPMPLNTLPGLEALPPEITIPGYDRPNDFVPRRTNFTPTGTAKNLNHINQR